MNGRIIYRKSVLDKSVAEQYEVVARKNKALLLRHLLAETSTREYQLLLKAGNVLLEKFNRIEILPELHENDIAYRKKIMPGTKENKNPDFRIDGVYWELENPTFPYNYNKIVQRIRRGYHQADHVVLYFEKTVNGFTVQKAVSDRFQINKDFKEVIIIVGDKLVSHIKNKPGK